MFKFFKVLFPFSNKYQWRDSTVDVIQTEVAKEEPPKVVLVTSFVNSSFSPAVASVRNLSHVLQICGAYLSGRNERRAADIFNSSWDEGEQVCGEDLASAGRPTALGGPADIFSNVQGRSIACTSQRRKWSSFCEDERTQPCWPDRCLPSLRISFVS